MCDCTGASATQCVCCCCSSAALLLLTDDARKQKAVLRVMKPLMMLPTVSADLCSGTHTAHCRTYPRECRRVQGVWGYGADTYVAALQG